MNKKIYKSAKANLISLEILREFVKSATKPKVFCLNLVLRNKENSNLRLWTLREKLGKSCEEFADILNVDIVEYKKYEFQGNKIPDDFIKEVCKKFYISEEWLKCKVPFFPLPMKKKKTSLSINK